VSPLAGVIPAKAGNQYTSHQGIARGEAPCGQRMRHAFRASLLIGELVARLRGHDVVVVMARPYDLARIGDEDRGKD
jgi:hypothetical protein